HVYSLAWPRPLLHQRINQRVQQMFLSGLVDEVKGLLQRHTELSRTARQAVGYREVIAWLQANDDESGLDHVRDEVATHTRQLAKRQETWLRSMSEITMICVDDQTDWRQLVTDLVMRTQSGRSSTGG
ncbi:MAG: tRNA dimethylallyltransferase, partial [Planctomycetota bacterium]